MKGLLQNLIVTITVIKINFFDKLESSNLLSNSHFLCLNFFQTWKSPPTSGYRGRIYPDITITYDNPKTYKGPVIKGVSRECHQFIFDDEI